MGTQRRHVLGIPVDVVTEASTLAYIRDSVDRGLGVQIVTLNAEMVVRARNDSAFRAVVQDAGLVTPDGAGILWALARQGVRLRRRVGGSDLVWTVSDQAAHLGHRVFLLGGQEGVAQSAAERLRNAYPDLTVAGTLAGSPAQAFDAETVELIRKSRADILFVAFGAPSQELWIARNLTATGVAVALGVGGSLDYLAGTARRAPRWMQDRGLEWLWRLIRQPTRWRRMLALPRFAWLVMTSRET